MAGRIRTLLLAVVIAGLGLATIAPGGMADPAPARAATSLELCGKVAVYVKASALLPGAVTIGAVPFVIKAGTSISSAVKLGANVCVRLTLDGSGSITDLVALDASATTTVKLCGEVTAYVKATATEAGSVKIAGRTFEIAQGASLPAAVKVGADVCATLTLNVFGQVKDGDVMANATSTVKLCADVTAYAKASASAAGALKLGGHSFVLAPGATLPASVAVGADLCLTLVLNAFAQVQDGSAQANVLTNLDVCGKVTAFEDATATSHGSITVAGVSKKIEAGTSVANSVKVNAYLDLRLGVNAFGRVGKVTVLKAGVSVDDACGTGPAPTPDPTPTPTPKPAATPTPTPAATLTPKPNATPTPTPNALPTPSGSPTPNGSPTPDGAPTPDGSPTPDPDATPTPTPTPDPNATPTPVPTPSPTGTVGGVEEECVPDPAAGGTGGSGGGNGPSNPGQAPVLPDTATVGRAMQLIGTAAIPFALFVLGLFAGQLITRRRRDEQSLVPLLSTDAGREQQ